MDLLQHIVRSILDGQNLSRAIERSSRSVRDFDLLAGGEIGHDAIEGIRNWRREIKRTNAATAAIKGDCRGAADSPIELQHGVSNVGNVKRRSCAAVD